MPTRGKIEYFDPEIESWSSYTERLGHYFIANKVEEEKRKSTFLAVCGPSTFEPAKNLVQPKTINKISH